MGRSKQPVMDPMLPRLEQEVHAAVVRPDGNVDFAEFQAEYERRLAERHDQLRNDAMASFRAMDGWDRIRTQEDWEATVAQADADLESGAFLIAGLGAERFLDPPLMAVLLALRRRLIDEHGAETAAELMIIDSTVLSYYHLMRINGWIGDLQRWLESEFFSGQPLTAQTAGNDPRRVDMVRGLTVQEIVSQLVEKLMPLLDRSNRMMLRNLKALKTLRADPGPSVSIGSAGQVNVAHSQVNAAAD